MRDGKIVDVELLRGYDNRAACRPDTIVVESTRPEDLELVEASDGGAQVTIEATVEFANPGPCAVETPEWDASIHEITYDLSGDVPTLVESSRSALEAVYAPIPHDPPL